MKFWKFLLAGLLWGLYGCNPSQVTQITPTSYVENTQTPVAEVTGTSVSLPLPSALTPTLELSTPVIAEPVFSASIDLDIPENLTQWRLVDLRNPASEAVIRGGASGYELDTEWGISKIEYVYQWWGLAAPVFDYQSLESQDGEFRRASEVVDPSLVQAFLASISNLHVSQSLLGGTSHTDDYPSWKIEITGQDGQHLLIFSDSTGNPGSGPWVVYYNGRFYAQYDGRLGETIAALFPGDVGSPGAAFYPGGREENTVYFNTEGWPRQLGDQQFLGLLPLADSFQYSLDLEGRKISGYLQGRSSIGGFGNMVIGNTNHLVEIQLLDGEIEVSCPFEFVEDPDDVAAVAWTFECPVISVKEEENFEFPIRVVFSTEDGKTWTTNGVLSGKWTADSSITVVPLSEELQEAFANEPSVLDLLSDHLVYYSAYSAERKDSGELLKGEIVLLGQASIGEREIRYTIGTPIVIENGKLLFWKLNREKLNSMLSEIAVLSITQNAVALAPDLILNLWYSEIGEFVSLNNYSASISWPYEITLPACGNVPQITFPDSTYQLRAFSYNGRSWLFYQPDFILLDGQPIVANLDLWPERDDRGGLLSILIPSNFDTGDKPVFTRVWMQGGPFFGESPQLVLGIPEGTTSENLAFYEQIVNNLPATAERISDIGWRISNITFKVTDGGTMEVIACTPE